MIKKNLFVIILQYYERISVPRFGSNRPAVFVHDFRKVIYFSN